jgi:hypothetical protein
VAHGIVKNLNSGVGTCGTCRFAGATGDISAICEVDLVKGTVFRYSGEVCFGAADRD